MLGKLLKHDFKSTGKVLIPLYLFLVLVTIIGSILLGTKILQRDEMLPLAIALLIMYILMIFAISVITIIFLTVSYYRNMFSAQGYLTFTLPASTWSIFNSKVIVGFCWVLINSILTFLSAITLIGSAAGFKTLGMILREVFFTDLFTTVEPGMGSNSSLLSIMGYTPAQFILLMIIMVLGACFYSVAMTYGCVTIGQLFAKHKVAGAILTYAVLYFVLQIVMTVAMLFISFRGMFDILADAYMSDEVFVETMQSIYRPIFPLTIGIYLFVGIACYVASIIILKKKVNLD